MLESSPFVSFKRFGITFSTSIDSLIRFTKENMARSKPTWTATVKFTNTVNRKVTARTRESLDFNLIIWVNDLYSLIFQATRIKIGAMLASGMWDAKDRKSTH